MARMYRSIPLATLALLGGSGLFAGGAFAGGSSGPASAAATHLLTCNGKGLTRPAGEVVISCGDGNFAIDDTRWSSWSASSAQGMTNLQINLCNPNCAASKMTTFKDSGVRLFDARHTSKYGEVFTRIAVTYTHDGKKTTATSYPFS